VSIAGATGVLVNITGGADLTLGEVHQINEIIHDAVGDEAEIIFGAVHEPAMQGEIRVTVIATGFNRIASVNTPPAPSIVSPKGSPVIPFPVPTNRPTRVTGVGKPTQVNPPVTNRDRTSSQEMSDMEIPTFIRRQMD
jgi:cell division protein FtsZ